MLKPELQKAKSMKITKEMGNNHFFGIPGSGVPLDLMDNGRDIGVDFINVAHESSAAIANGRHNESARQSTAKRRIMQCRHIFHSRLLLWDTPNKNVFGKYFTT